MLKIVYLFLVFAATNVLAQQQSLKQLNGKVTADAAVLEGVYVLNKKTDKVTITSQNGDFNIQAAVGDTLLFRVAQFNETKMRLTPKDFEQGILLVKMIPTINELREVVVKNDINATAMGIIPKGQKSYSAAERKLYTASDLNASATAGTMMGGSVSADPLLNWISGRTKMLKKGLEVEKKESYLRQLENLFTADYFVTTLKIPAEYVKRFEYYSVENEQFVAVLKSKNVTMAGFLLGELAFKYKQIIASEN